MNIVRKLRCKIFKNNSYNNNIINTNKNNKILKIMINIQL